MAKVKKETGFAGERHTKGKSARGKAKGATKASKQQASTGAKKRSASRKSVATQGRKRVKTARKQGTKRSTPAKRASQRALAVVRGRASDAPVVRVAITPLDPLRKCGPGTSVQFLYRVDEQVNGRTTAHLVFFDRHGWYCEHGRSCPAVGHARKFNGRIARVS